MEVPLIVRFKDVPYHEPAERLIREKAADLEKVCDYIISCHVAVERPQSHLESGTNWRVRVLVTVPPGHEIVVRQEGGKNDMHDPLGAVIRDAFDATRRRLNELVERQRGEVKRHRHEEVQAVVEKIFYDQGYGFLRTIDNRQVYFHRNSVLHHGFTRLQPGTGVRFIEETGHKGPQAVSVKIVEIPDGV